MSTVPAEVHGPSDAELIDLVRKGTVSAYGSLYERHVGAAYNLARQLSRSQSEADDLVSEAFAKVLDTLRTGRGPDSAFRAYLLTALRHTAYDKTRRDRKVELSGDVTTITGADTAIPFSDTAVAGLERSLAARAFARLPERWQAVLWHTEVEGQTPAEVAPVLGLTPNGVSALAYRAREGLRQAYLQVHLAESDSERCHATAERLGAWTRGGLSKRETAQVESHLDDCARCRALAAELADVNGGMRGVVAPLVLGVGALGYLAATGAKAGSAAAAGVTAGTAAGAGAAGGAASSLPRQFIGVAASATALVAAVALALASGTVPQLPAAQPAPITSAPASPNSPAPPAPVIPPPPQNVPPPPVVTPSPAPSIPAPSIPAPAPPAPNEPAPPPVQPPVQLPPPAAAPPNLSTPTLAPITLTPGTASELPIVVSNTGGSVSEPVNAALVLPPGVAAVEPSRMTGPGLLRLNGAQPTSSVPCPAGIGMVSCTSGRGLQPGESVTLLFRLIATEDSLGGEITGTVMAGTSISIDVSVRIDVKPLRDDVSVFAFPDWRGIGAPGKGRAPGVHVLAKNKGESTKQITVTFNEPAAHVTSWPAATCTTNKATTSCVTNERLKPGERLWLTVSLSDWGNGETRAERKRPSQEHRKVQVTATLGTASATTVVTLPWWNWPPDPEPPTSTTKPTPTSTPSTPTRTTSTKPTEPPHETTKPAETPVTETPPPPVLTTPTRVPPPEPPPSDECDQMSEVERLLAILTGRCPNSPTPS